MENRNQYISQETNILLIAGENGAGKNKIQEIFLKKCISGKSYIIDMRKEIIMTAQNQGIFLQTDDEISEYATRMRRIHGAGYFLKEALDRINTEYAYIIVNSMRHPDEYKVALGYTPRVYVVGVLAAPLNASKEEKELADMLRFKRIQERGDGVRKYNSFEEFLAKDKKEWIPLDDLDFASQNVKGCIDLAVNPTGFLVINNAGEDYLEQQLVVHLSEHNLLAA
jgi:hypothetical protein